MAIVVRLDFKYDRYEINYMNIKKLLPNIPKLSFQEYSKHLNRLSSDPYVDWVFIVTIWTVLFITFSGVGYWTFSEVSTRINSAPTNQSTTTIGIFDEQRLDRVLREFDNRRQEWIRLKDGDYSFPEDPSS